MAVVIGVSDKDVQERLSEILENSYSDLLPIYQGGTSRQIVRLAKKHTASVALINLQLDGSNALKTADLLLRENPNIAIVILYSDANAARLHVIARVANRRPPGTSGFALVPKSASQVELTSAIGAILSQNTWIHPDLLTQEGKDKEVWTIKTINDQRERVRPVSHLLERIKDPALKKMHNLKGYAISFRSFPKMGCKFLAGGADALTFKLSDGNVLKLSRRPLLPEHGRRSFDMPVLEQGVCTDGSEKYFWYTQPFASLAPASVLKRFLVQVRDEGFEPHAIYFGNVGIYDGELKLLDPFEVTPMDDEQKLAWSKKSRPHSFHRPETTTETANPRPQSPTSVESGFGAWVHEEMIAATQFQEMADSLNQATDDALESTPSAPQIPASKHRHPRHSKHSAASIYNLKLPRSKSTKPLLIGITLIGTLLLLLSLLKSRNDE